MESRSDARYGLAGYAAMGLDSDAIYGCRPSTSLQQLSPRQAKPCYDGQPMGLDQCPPVGDMGDDGYAHAQAKKSPPGNGKKTKGRVKIKMEYIENKLRRYTTFSKRKTGIMKKAYELSTLTGTQVMLLVASETGHVYTFATRKLQPMITSEAGKALIQTCLNSPDPPGGGSASGADQRMSATGFEETELTYNISDEDSKDEDGAQGDDLSSSDEDLDLPGESSFHLNDNFHKKDVQPEEITCKPLIESISPSLSKSNTSTTISEPLGSVSLNSQSPSSSKSPQNQSPLLIPSPQLQALPLLVQTPAGVGYATLPNGMILGMIQGLPSSSQQLVAIPQNSVPQLPSMQTATKEVAVKNEPKK